jgi:CBS domain-containing protein
MPIAEICTGHVVVASRETPLTEAAKLMRRFHVGDVIVIEEKKGRQVPVGIVTDRDIVVEVLAEGLECGGLTVGDVMSSDLITVRDSEGIIETVRLMRSKGTRRVPVVNAEGALVGIVSVDDLIQRLAGELGDLAKLVFQQQRREAKTRA